MILPNETRASREQTANKLLGRKEQKDKNFKELRVLIRQVVKGLHSSHRWDKKKREAKGITVPD